MESKATYTLHASIAKLEQLVHEATRLAENAIWLEQGNNTEAPASSHDQSLEQNHQKNAPIHPKDAATKTVSGRSSALDSFRTARPSIKTVTSLPAVKAAVAEPILTLPSSRSTEALSWRPSKSPGTEHEERQDDIIEHLHDAACPASRPVSKETIRIKHFSSELLAGEAEKSSIAPFAKTPAFRLIVEDTDEHAGVGFSRRYEPGHSSDGLGGQAESISSSLFNQPNRSPKSPTGDNSVRSRNGGQPSEIHLAIPHQPTPTLSPPDGGLSRRVRTGHERHYSTVFGLPSRQVSINLTHPAGSLEPPKIDLRNKSYVDVYHEGETFDVHETCHHASIARNWPDSRKRFTAIVACINTSCIGLLIGIYAGEVPAIQYAIADFGHYSILGNVLMYSGLAISSLIFWPLPLLHGRKPYTITAGLLALVLQVPQGLAVAGYRDPDVPAWKCLLLISRAISGFVLGLSDMNHKAMLLDCFGASLRSQGDDPLDIYDVRKHGGGIGMWLGFVSWSTVGPISIGFMVGASIVGNEASVSWGFWVSLCILLVVLLLNIVTPEVRRSAFRRTLAEMAGEGGGFSRVTRGEIKMHLTATGPY